MTPGDQAVVERRRILKWKPWYTVVALSFFGWATLYAGRAVLSPVLGTIGREWALDEAQLGLVGSVFFLSYAAMQVPTGLLADRLGRKGLLLGGLLLFTVATALRGVAPSYVFFVLAGGFAGLAQGTYFATQFALSSAAVPVGRRALGSAIIFSGMSVGIAGGYLIGSLVTFDLGWGWRAPFIMVAVPSAVMVVAFAAAIREPRVGPPAVAPGSTPPGFVSAEAAPIPTVAARTPAQAPPTSTRATRIPVRAALSRDLLVTYAINVLALYAFFMLLNWLPYYLQSEQGVSEAASGLVSSLMPWASIPSALAAGLLSDRLGDRIAPLRLLLPAAALTVFGLAVVRGPAPLYGLIIAYGLVGKSTSDPLLTARAAELAPPERLATVMGFLNFSGMVASVAAPFVTGLLIRASGTMAPAFYLAGGLLLVAAVLALLTGRRTVLKSAPS